MQGSITTAVSNQVLIMAIYIAIGFIFTKVKMFSHSGTKEMTTLLLYAVTPCVIVKSFQEGYTSDSIQKLGLAFVIAIAIHLAFFVFSKLVYLKSKNTTRSCVNKFSVSYSNCGFMGIPLLSAALGAEGVFIGSAYLAVFNVFVWTQGYSMFSSRREKASVLKAILNPGVIGVALAAILVFSGIKLPQIAVTAIDGMAALNTPVAMVLLGIYLAETNLIKALSSPGLYVVCLLRLILLPFVVIVFLKLIGISTEIAYPTVLSAACPCAAISAIFASQFNKDPGYASSVVAVSTLFSLGTLPLVAYVASYISAL